MSLMDWAENEVKIACKREDPEEKEWDYGTVCYKSALKAFKSLTEDGHSGMSIGFTKNILNRLIDGKPLTEITDDDFFIKTNKDMPIGDSPEYLKEHGLKSTIQCPRMSSLFRYEYLDGRIEYTDNDRQFAYQYDDPHKIGWHNGLIKRLIDKMYPITMPYYPSAHPMEVATDEFLTDKRNGDFDTIGILEIFKDGERIKVDRYFKEDWFDENWVELSKDEFEERSKRRIER